MPDFKTVADFCRDDGPATKTACRQFVLLCRKLNRLCRRTLARTSSLSGSPGRSSSSRQQIPRFRDVEVGVQAAPDRQISPTGLGARSMSSGGKATGIVGHTVRIAIDCSTT